MRGRRITETPLFQTTGNRKDVPEVKSCFSFEELNRENGFQMSDYWIWCGSPAADPAGGYHLYASRWSMRYPMYIGYLLSSEIVRAYSPEMTGPFRFCETVLPTGNPADWNGRMAHNPRVLPYGKRWLLYYIALTYDGPPVAERSFVDRIYERIRIGLATADAPGGPWRFLPEPILNPVPGSWDAAIVTNPAPCVAPDGRIFLYYRSNTPDGLRIGLAVAESPEGPYRRVVNRPVLDFHVEDPFVWHDGERFRMIAKDISGELCGEKIAGAHFVSSNGVDWKLGTPAKAYSRHVRYRDGEEVTLGCLERPSLLFDATGNPVCLYGAVGTGGISFHHITRSWNLALPIRRENIDRSV